MRKNRSRSPARRAITVLSSSIVILFSFISYSVGAERLSYVVQPRDSISFLCFKIYGRFGPELVKRLSAINQDVKDWDNLPQGQIITLLPEKEMNRAVPEDPRDLAVITFVRHPVRVKQGTETVLKEAQLNMTLAPNDFIEVEPGGRVELMLSGGRIIRLDEGSALEIGTLKSDLKQGAVIGKFKLFLGRLWGKILKSRFFRKKEMYVATSTLVAGVRGTAYDLILAHDQAAIIKVFEGEVEIYNPLQRMPESGAISDFKKPHRVTGPKRGEGPRRVSEKEWDQIVLQQYQQITVTTKGIGPPIIFDYEAERRIEWIRWNEARDLKAVEVQAIAGQLRSPVSAND